MAKLPGHTEEHERAKRLRMHLDTLRKMRKRGEGQAYVVVGRQIHYVDADEPRWLASLKVTPPRRESRAEVRSAGSARGGSGKNRVSAAEIAVTT
jgi:hypothetical protein